MNMRSIQDLYLCVVSFSETFVLQRLPAPQNLVRKQILVIAFSLTAIFCCPERVGDVSL
jgi:hypothetical protein